MELEKKYDKVIDRNPNDAEVYKKRGDSCYHQGKYDSAILNYNTAIELKENYLEAYYQRAITYDALKQYLRAIQDYAKVIEANPDFDDADNKFDSAFLNYRQKPPSSLTEDYYERANDFYHSMDYFQAVQNYAKVLECDPRHKSAFDNLKLAYDNLGFQSSY